ncbi:Putative alpha/beta hydrolase-1 [Colletotrichum destructivum]|uniref:Alpha/beta hydrolase-1 n=1 Tax=Colletotrichum destructivum TaxID=34406 RepID=A0AAX4IMD6_9PEZI|nr:Putative alpha/beta hydrolase-1 [Colletotrichum destructivum]
MPNLPTLLFIPGSWHKPSCYDKITRILQEKHGLRCISVTLPSTTGDPAATFGDDVDAARQALSRETAQGRNVVVIAHSYGGMVGNSVIKGFAPPRDAAKGSSAPATSSTRADHRDALSEGHVIGLILIASGFTLTGLAFMDPFFGRPPPGWRVNSTTGYAELVADPRKFFYHDLPPEEAEFWTSQLTTQSLKALFEGGEHAYAGWQDVPAWYIGTVQDQGLPVVAQRMTVGMAREMGAKVEHRELQTSHSPFLSQPENTASIVLEAVEAFAGTSIDAKPRRGVGTDERLPVPRLWQPLTWFRFGLPLIFGRILGRSFLVFDWGRRLFRPK